MPYMMPINQKRRYSMAIVEGCTACFDLCKEEKETEDVLVTRLYSFKWMKVERKDGTAEYVRALLLKEKE